MVFYQLIAFLFTHHSGSGPSSNKKTFLERKYLQVELGILHLTVPKHQLQVQKLPQLQQNR